MEYWDEIPFKNRGGKTKKMEKIKLTSKTFFITNIFFIKLIWLILFCYSSNKTDF